VEQVHSQWGGLTGFEHDLDPNADLLMVVDAYNEKKNLLHQRGPQASLVNEIVRYFGVTIPSVVLQTAASPKVAFEEAPGWSSCLGSALNSALAGIFLYQIGADAFLWIDVELQHSMHKFLSSPSAYRSYILSPS